MFQLLRLPRPGGVSQALARLQAAELVVRRTSGGSWSLTPHGRERTAELVESVDVAAVEAEIAEVGGAQLSEAPHVLIPAEMAPSRWSVGIARLLAQFPFEQNVFCMTRFPKAEPEDKLPDPVQAVIGRVRSVLSQHGLHVHLASDRLADDELFGNVAAHMWSCKYGIALFETRFSEDYNDNMQIEVGGMLITGRRVALLKDRDTPKMPTDFVGHIFKEVDYDELDSIGAAAHAWAANDLGLGRCSECPA